MQLWIFLGRYTINSLPRVAYMYHHTVVLQSSTSLMTSSPHAGELTPFSELVSPDYKVLSSPRTTGRGGGLAAVFKSTVQCRQAPSDRIASFELQLFESLESLFFNHGFCWLFGVDYIKIWPSFNCGFNIHVHCPNRPLVKDFSSTPSILLSQWLAQHTKKDTRWTLCCLIV